MLATSRSFARLPGQPSLAQQEQKAAACCALLRTEFPHGVHRATSSPTQTEPFSEERPETPWCAALSEETQRATRLARVARFLDALRKDSRESYRDVHARLLLEVHPDKRGRFACRHCTEELLAMRGAVQSLRTADPHAEGRAATEHVIMAGLFLAAGCLAHWSIASSSPPVAPRTVGGRGANAASRAQQRPRHPRACPKTLSVRGPLRGS